MQGFSFQFGQVLQFWWVLIDGVVATFKLAAISLSFGLLFGLVLGLGRLSRIWPIRFASSAFVEVFRNTPALVQLIWFFYVLPVLTSSPQNVFFSSAVALSFNCGAFSAEIFRGGIESINRGQWEAARAIGMRQTSVLRHIIIPQAIKRMIPALANRGIEVFKLTALAGTLGYTDLLYQGQLISSATYRPIESYTMVAGVYVVILSVFAMCTRMLEARLKHNE